MNRLSLSQKLWLPLLLAWVGLLALTIWDATQTRRLQLAEREQALADIVEMAYTTAAGLEKAGAAGTLTPEAAKADAIARIADMRFTGNGYLTIVGTNSAVVMHPINPKLNGKDMSAWQDAKGDYLYRNIAALGSSPQGAGYLEYWWPRPGASDPSPKMGYVKRFQPWGWDFIAGAYKDDIEASFRATLRNSIAMLVVLGILISSLAAMAIRSVRRSLGGEPVEAARLAREIAAGDLTGTIDVKAGDDASVVAAIAYTRDTLASTVARVKQVADAINVAAGEIAAGNADLSSRTEEQAASLEETAAAMDQLTATVRQNADNAAQASRLAGDASSEASNGGQVVEQVVSDVRAIAESSKQVADITSVIDGIAFQTNILALNAAVEAARAGENGRGFAVVAGEVRNLAQRSAAAAKEIRVLIDASLSRIEAGADRAESAGQAMGDIVRAVARVTTIVDEIASASKQQSLGIEEINRAVSQMDGTTQRNAALVEEAAAAAAQLKEQAAHLGEVTAVFRLNRAVHGGRTSDLDAAVDGGRGALGGWTGAAGDVRFA